MRRLSKPALRGLLGRTAASSSPYPRTLGYFSTEIFENSRCQITWQAEMRIDNLTLKAQHFAPPQANCQAILLILRKQPGASPEKQTPTHPAQDSCTERHVAFQSIHANKSMA